jgi:hypothetical protein
MLKIIWYPFMALALMGFVASLAVHIPAWLGLTFPFEVFGLHFGIFVVWIPAMLASYGLTGGARGFDYYRYALRGCPKWMRWSVYGLFGYTFVNFFSGFLGFFTGTPMERLFSGHWMLFYFVAFATLYSATHAKDFHCLNGHKLMPGANFCSQCGAPLAAQAEVEMWG